LTISLTETERSAASEILQKAGFTSAWIYDDVDPTEIIFLVPSDELDPPVRIESPRSRRISLSLMSVLPHVKVALVAYQEDVPKSKLY
jgi:hypothetical protein